MGRSIVNSSSGSWQACSGRFLFSSRLTAALQSGYRSMPSQIKRLRLQRLNLAWRRIAQNWFQRLLSGPSTSPHSNDWEAGQLPKVTLFYWNPKKMRCWEVQQGAMTHRNMSHFSFAWWTFHNGMWHKFPLPVYH